MWLLTAARRKGDLRRTSKKKGEQAMQTSNRTCPFGAPPTVSVVEYTKPLVGRVIMREIDEVLREKENNFEQVRREVDALRLAVQLLEEPEDSPADTASGGSGVETCDVAAGGAMTVSARLKRMAASVAARVFFKGALPPAACPELRQDRRQQWRSRIRDLADSWQWRPESAQKQLAPVLCFGNRGTDCSPSRVNDSDRV
jgi:hypothetical protein